jgi:hypothetical protein
LFVEGVYVHVNSGFLQMMSSMMSAYEGGMNLSSSIIAAHPRLKIRALPESPDAGC